MKTDTEFNYLLQQNKKLCMAIDHLISVVGLTAIKHENQRLILQKAVNVANKALVECDWEN